MCMGWRALIGGWVGGCGEGGGAEMGMGRGDTRHTWAHMGKRRRQACA
jgi:hypothetical protein